MDNTICLKRRSLRTPRRAWPKLLGALTLGIGLAAVNAAGQTQTLVFAGSAFGTYAHVGNTVILGETATVSTPGCGTEQFGFSKTGTVTSVSHQPEAATGLINTSAATSTSSVVTTADVHQISLLSGIITAEEIKASSTVTRVSGGLQASAAGSSLLNLVVAGNSIATTPAPNTTINLPGFGRVVLNQQSTSSSLGSRSLLVIMIHVYITEANPQNIPVGTDLLVAVAQTNLTVLSGPALVAGGAWGTVISGQSIQSSSTAPATLPCAGTNGAWYTNTAASVNTPAPAVINAGEIVDSVQGNVTPSLVDDDAVSTIQSVNLLNGLVTAGLLRSWVHGSTTDGNYLEFTDQSTMEDVRVAGLPEVMGMALPNTEVNLPGVGTLWLHRVITTENYMDVRMIELVVDQANIYKLPIGTDLIVGQATARLYSNAKPGTP